MSKSTSVSILLMLLYLISELKCSEFLKNRLNFPASGLRIVIRYFASGYQGEFLEFTMGRNDVSGFYVFERPYSSLLVPSGSSLL